MGVRVVIFELIGNAGVFTDVADEHTNNSNRFTENIGELINTFGKFQNSARVITDDVGDFIQYVVEPKTSVKELFDVCGIVVKGIC